MLVGGRERRVSFARVGGQEAALECLEAVLKVLGYRVVVAAELRDIEEVVRHWILLSQVRAVADLA